VEYFNCPGTLEIGNITYLFALSYENSWIFHTCLLDSGVFVCLFCVCFLFKIVTIPDDIVWGVWVCYGIFDGISGLQIISVTGYL
jgi:hypothetical protein